MTGRIRRSPFAERTARRSPGQAGRVRYIMGAVPDLVPDSRRRDPRAERARQTVAGAAGRRRIIWGAVRPGQAAVAASAQGPRTIRVDNPAMLVLVAPDFDDLRLSRFDRQMIGAARLVADSGQGAVGVLCPPDLPQDQKDALAQAGADRLFLLPTDRHDPHGQARAILHWLGKTGAQHILFPESPDGADKARRVTVAGGFGFMGGIQAFSARAAIAPCHAQRRERVAQALPQVMTLEPDRVAAYSGLPHEITQTEPMEGEPSPPTVRVRLGEAVAGDPASLPLAEAPFVVAAGNGVTDFGAFATLVTALGGTPGASRVVCDAGHMPRQTQVGASGTVLDAACYLAMGISGAPQHLQGIGRVESIIAVNTDLHAAMVARASLAIIADAQEVMPALLRLLHHEGGSPCA